MNKESAISIIDNCHGFMTEGTSACEAWDFIQEYITKMENALNYIIQTAETVPDTTAEVEVSKEALEFAFNK